MLPLPLPLKNYFHSSQSRCGRSNFSPPKSYIRLLLAYVCHCLTGSLHPQSSSHKFPVLQVPLPPCRALLCAGCAHWHSPGESPLSSPAPGSPHLITGQRRGSSAGGAGVSCFVSSSWLTLARRKLKVGFAPVNTRHCSHRPWPISRCSLWSTCLLL